MNNRLTKWFPIKSRVGQGASLSTTLFALFINHLAAELKEANVGIKIGVPLIMYAEDVVILTEMHVNAQKGLDILGRWCSPWGRGGGE